MDAPQDEFYSKPEPEVWIAFDCREREAKERLHRERCAWAPCSSLENLGYGRVVLVVRPGGARGLAK